MEVSPKLIAFYLPQFHCIKENNEWWGDGFTDWINVKKALPIFNGHRQPRIPLNDNYYDLSDDNVFSWQINLAKNYGVDAFCFYHYWFGGKVLLEKPIEMYLTKNELNFQFCLSWANEPWTRSWDGKQKEILINQNYMGVDDIKSHIEYLLPFFKDDRYIKIDNKPLFIIYRTNNIVYFDQLLDTWSEVVKNEGFSGIYICETLTGFQKKKYSKRTDGTIYMEPMWVIGRKNIIKKLWTAKHSPIKKNRIENYDRIWNKILLDEKLNENIFAGAFVDWDNSPRKKTRNLIIKGSSPENFENYLGLQYEKAKKVKSQYIFVNAWNEWAEGTYLEPDSYYGIRYLEAIKRVKEKYNDCS